MNTKNNIDKLPKGFVMRGVKVVSDEKIPELGDGEIDVSHLQYDQIIRKFDDVELEHILKECNCHRPKILGPVSIYFKAFSKKPTAIVAKSKHFESIEDLSNFLKENKVLVYTICHNTIHDKYLLRAYTESGEYVKYNTIDKIYTDIALIFSNIKEFLKKRFKKKIILS